MMLVHLPTWWLPRAEYGASDLFWMVRILGGLAPALFLFVLGYALVLRTLNRQARALPPGYPGLLRRGSLLILGGYGMNLLIFQFSPDQGPWTANILHTLGLCVWLGVPFLLAPAPVLKCAAIGAVLALSPWFWEITFPAPLVRTVAAWVIGTPYAGYFPLFPWAAFSLLGMLMAQLQHQAEAAGWEARWQWVSTTTAIVCVAGAEAYSGLFDHRWVMSEARFAQVTAEAFPQYWRPRAPFVLLVTGLTVLLWRLLHTHCSGMQWVPACRLGPSRWLPYLVTLGRAALLLYVAHYLVGHRLFGLLGLSRGFTGGGNVPLPIVLVLLGWAYALAYLLADWWVHGAAWRLPGPSVRVRRAWAIGTAVSVVAGIGAALAGIGWWGMRGDFPPQPAWQARVALGWDLYGAREYRRAAEAFEDSLLALAENPEALQGAGLARYQLGEHEEAARLLAQAARLRPGQIEEAGWAFYHRRWFGQALEAFETGLRVRGEDPGLHRGAGFAALRIHRYDRAIAHLEASLKGAASLPAVVISVSLPGEERPVAIRADAHTALGWAYYWTGAYPEARREFLLATAEHPDWVDAWSGLGWVALAFQDLEGAGTAFQAALRLEPGYTDALNGRAAVRRALAVSR